MLIVRKLVLSGIFVLFLTACGGGDDGGSAAAPKGLTIKTGEFLDSAVEGLEFAHSNGQSGITDANGTYSYGNGTIDFYIGDIHLGNANAEFMISPLNLAGTTNVANPTAVNIARFLQVLDDDGDASNGIQITQQMRDLAVGIGNTVNFAQSIAAFEVDPDVQAVVDTLTQGARTLASVSSDAAQSHLQDTLMTVRNDLAVGGKYTGTSSNTFSNCPSNYLDSVASGSIEVTSVSGSSFSGSGSFSATVRGITVKEDFTIDGTANLDGTTSGIIYSDAYQNGAYIKSDNALFEGKFNSRALQLKTQTRNLGGGCMSNGALIVVAR
jgi:hypothetical protein